MRAVWPRWVVGLAGALALATASADGRDDDAAALRRSQSAIGHSLGDYRFTAADGRSLQLGQLRGRPLVLNLVYTECYSVCSGLTLHLRDVVRIARQALGQRSFAVLTVGFDAAHDSPERMRTYGRERGLIGPDWQVVSADAATIDRLTDDVGFSWSTSPGGFDHIAQVTIVDGNGRVVAQVYGQQFSPPELVEPLRDLLLGGTAPRSGVQGLLDQVRLRCSVYDPSVGRYRFDYSMFAGLFPALLMLGVAAVAALFVARRPR